jgi:hypothetical protein
MRESTTLWKSYIPRPFTTSETAASRFRPGGDDHQNMTFTVSCGRDAAESAVQPKARRAGNGDIEQVPRTRSVGVRDDREETAVAQRWEANP